MLVTFLDEAELPAIDPRQASAERLIARMKAGIPFGGAPDPSREEEAPIGPEQREALRQEALAEMRRGIDLGGPPYPTREELNERSR